MKTLPRILISSLIAVCMFTVGIVMSSLLDELMRANVSASSRGTGIAGDPSTASQLHTAKGMNHEPRIAVSHEGFVYPVDHARDPFQQRSNLVETQQQPPSAVKQLSITLTGIVWNQENPLAIIADSGNNTHLVRTGEEVSKVEILSIRPTSVIIERDGKTQELVLWPAKLQ